MNATRPFKDINGTIECHIPHQEGYFDSHLTCIVFKMPYYLEHLYFGHISFIISLTVLLVSTFGNIKHTYKYFFINQALWDILLSYDFICDRPTNKYFGGIELKVREQWDNQKPSNCIYQAGATSQNLVIFFLYNVLHASVVDNPYFSTFLLSFSRFLAIFCHRFYQKFITPIKVTIFIIVFSIAYVICRNAGNLYPLIHMALNTERCKQLWCSNSSICPMEFTDCTMKSLFEGSYLNFLLSAASFGNMTPVVIVIITIVFMIANLSKITLQLYRQHKLKQKLVFSNFKIASVLASQCLTLFLIFLVRDYLTILKRFYDENSRAKSWPSWPDKVDYKSFTILKSVIDSIITLTVLSEYRQNIYRAFKIVICTFLKPFSRYQIFGSLKSETSSTVLFQRSTSKTKISK